MHTLLSSFGRQEQLGLKKKSSLTYVDQPSVNKCKEKFSKAFEKDSAFAFRPNIHYGFPE